MDHIHGNSSKAIWPSLSMLSISTAGLLFLLHGMLPSQMSTRHTSSFSSGQSSKVLPWLPCLGELTPVWARTHTQTLSSPCFTYLHSNYDHFLHMCCLSISSLFAIVYLFHKSRNFVLFIYSCISIIEKECLLHSLHSVNTVWMTKIKCQWVLI